MTGILQATAAAMLITLLGTPLLIEFFRARGVGQLIRQDGPAAHFVKHGTPTMGGLILLVAATIGYFTGHIRLTRTGIGWIPLSGTGILVLGSAWGLGIIGAVDDGLKLRRRRSLGLNKRTKFGGQVVVGFVLAYAAVSWTGVEPRISWTGRDLLALPAVPVAIFAVWIVLLIAGTSNAVNITDGLDGLACGASAMAFFVFTIVGFWEFRHPEFYGQLLGTSGYLDIAIAGAALLGGCLGFLWWNAAPARIFMGDTGALALGGALAALSLLTRTQLLLAIIGGLFVVETLSVILQVIAYRGFKGRRIFAMAPLHHHFELRGWAEFTVIVRFWLVGALMAGFGLALFYMDFLASGGLD